VTSILFGCVMHRSPTIREAFNELLVENHWMDEETRDVARDKANAMNERIGYPDYILNDSALTGIFGVLWSEQDQRHQQRITTQSKLYVLETR
jgi:predicted metalloendopeptidase